MRRLPKVEVPKHPDLRFEVQVWESGLSAVAGLDEAGRGAWAGPVAAGGFAESHEVDALGIVPATRLAMERALTACNSPAQHLLVDAVRLPGVDIPQQALIKGDARSLSIAAASVLAKTARDAVMIEMEETFPGYGFALNKGYGTAIHRAGLDEIGPCAMHRFSFTPVRERVSSDPV